MPGVVGGGGVVDRTRAALHCERVACARPAEEGRRMAAASRVYSNDASSLIGTPEQVAEHIRQCAALGVSHMQIRFADFPKTDGIRLFMDAVMPRFMS